MEKLNTYGEWIIDRWRPLVASVVLIILMVCVMAVRLGTLNKAATVPEVTYLQSLQSGKNLWLNPTFLVHKLPTYLLFKLGFRSVAVYRLVSVFFAGITVVSGFVILKKAYSNRVAILGAVLLLTSAWTLHIARSATPESSFLLLLPLLLIAAWLHTTNHHYASLLILFLIIVMSFYIPGFWWLSLAVLLWEHTAVFSALKSVPWWFRIIGGLVIIIGLVPLAWASIHNGQVLLAISGLPTHFSDVRFVGKNLLHIPINLFVRGPNDPARWLGRLPILDIFSSVMLFLGVYSLRYHLKQHIVRFIVVSSFIVIILVSAGGQTTITALIPLLYIFIGAGIAFMLQQWMTVFPHNPIARTVATTLLSISVLLVTYYHLNQYFIAWPETPATKHAFGHVLNLQ